MVSWVALMRKHVQPWRAGVLTTILVLLRSHRFILIPEITINHDRTLCFTWILNIIQVQRDSLPSVSHSNFVCSRHRTAHTLYIPYKIYLLLKESWVYIADGVNIRWIKIFQLYRGFFRHSTTQGLFVKGSARVVEPPRYEYKGFKYKYSLKGAIKRLLIVRVNRSVPRKDSRRLRLHTNSAIVIFKKQNPRSKYHYGPVLKNLHRKKFLSLFKYII